MSFSGLARRLPTICETSWQRGTSNSDSRQKKDVLKNILFSNYYCFCGVKFRAKFEVLLQKQFLSVVHAFKINWIGLFYFTLNNRKWENSLCVFQRNSPKYSNDQRGKLDWNWLKFYGQRKTGLRAITAPSYKQPNKLSQLPKRAIEFTYSDFPCHFKVNRDKLALTNHRWMSKRRQKIDDYR